MSYLSIEMSQLLSNLAREIASYRLLYSIQFKHPWHYTVKNKKSDHLHDRIFLVGVAGFEPATSASQTRRDNRATLHPEF